MVWEPASLVGASGPVLNTQSFSRPGTQNGRARGPARSVLRGVAVDYQLPPVGQPWLPPVVQVRVATPAVVGDREHVAGARRRPPRDAVSAAVTVTANPLPEAAPWFSDGSMVRRFVLVMPV